MTESSRFPTGRFVCASSGDTYPDTELWWRGDTGELLDIDWEPRFDLDLIRRRKGTLWRYREGISLREDANIVSLDAGFTPLTDVTLDGRNVLFKQDHLFPSGSNKDCGVLARCRGRNQMRSHTHRQPAGHLYRDRCPSF